MTERRYCRLWPENPKGIPEDPERCITELSEGNRYGHQCSNKRGFGPDGLYCQQHAKQARERFEPIDRQEAEVSHD